MVFKKKQPEVVKTYEEGNEVNNLGQPQPLPPLEDLDRPPIPPQQQVAPSLQLPLTLVLKIDETGKIHITPV